MDFTADSELTTLQERAATPAATQDGSDLDHTDFALRRWVDESVRRIEADSIRSADTHLLRFPLPEHPGVDLYLKDESTHPTGSLKHRLARSLVLFGLCNGWIRPDTTLVDASSGSTAISEAYFAQLLGLRFVAVVPSTTSPDKLALIQRAGGSYHLVGDPTTVYAQAARLAAESGGHYLDQFTNAERATDWRGNNNIAESIFAQMTQEPHPVPTWVVVGAGTGGTSATIGRYIRLKRYPTRLLVVDPEGSAFTEGWRDDNPGATAAGSRIEGIGRPRVEPSFVPTVVDRMMTVRDRESVSHMLLATEAVGRRVGPSTGTNLYGALRLADEMRDRDQQGSIVTLICDGGERYSDTYYNRRWLSQQGIDVDPG